MRAIGQDFGQRTGAALGGALGQTLGSLSGSLLQGLLTSGTFLKEAAGNYLDPTPGTASLVDYVQIGGLARRYIAIYPTTPTPGAPVLILLHAHGMTPERMANLARVGRLAASEGAYVLVPEGQNKDWNDDPTSNKSVDDVGFLSALIAKAISAYKVDKTHIYVAGYSNGGFMAERLACEKSNLIAGIAAVASTMRTGLANNCSPTRKMPFVLMDGTSDPVIWYNGNLLFESVAETAAFWALNAGCPGSMTSAKLANQTSDGTDIALTSFTSCPAGTGVSAYTIDKGGHTWPDSDGSFYTLGLGKTTQNLDATTALWSFLIPFSRPN
ncbi:MAG: hypothetical protein JWR16_3497 [Nevskia sp.]|nr:hypothetical protein [Nevskia sp.]